MVPVLILIGVSIACGAIYCVLFIKDYKSGVFKDFEHPEI